MVSRFRSSFFCWIVLYQDTWVVCDAQRTMLSAVFFIRIFLSLALLSFLLPFRHHSRPLLPTGPIFIVSCREQPTISFTRPSWNSHWRPYLLGPTYLNYWRASKAVSQILPSPPPRRLFHFDDSCFAPGYYPRTLRSLSLSIRIHHIEDACSIWQEGWFP